MQHPTLHTTQTSMAKTLLKFKKKSVPLDRYAGKWVAFIDSKIVVSDENLKDLMAKAKKKGLEKKVSVFLVPRKDEGPYVLIFL